MGVDAYGPLAELLEKVPRAVAGSFTPEQLAALRNAVQPATWRKHPINIRVTLPFIGRRFFITLVGGQEHRGTDRILRERTANPLGTPTNILFMLGVGGAFYLVAVLGMFAFSNLIVF